MIYRIQKEKIFGNGDYGKKNFNCKPAKYIFAQGDILRNKLSKCLNLDIDENEKEFIEEIIFLIHDILCHLHLNSYSLEHLDCAIEAMNKKINKLKENCTDLPEFVSIPKDPGQTLDEARSQTRLFEVYLINESSNKFALNSINRLSTYLFWLAWSYHNGQADNIFRRKSDFSRFV